MSQGSQVLREATPSFAWSRLVDARRELMAGAIGALLVIPQAITFAHLAGVSPEMGLYCAVFVGLLASLLGNSAMVGGPNTAVSILIGATVVQYAGRGSPLYIEFVLILSLMVGLVQLLIWLLRGAVVFRYFSPAAITGIKVGVGVWLILSAVEAALGLAPILSFLFYEKFYMVLGGWGELVNPYAAITSAATVLTGLLLKRWRPRTYIIIAVLVGSAVGGVLYGWYGPVHTQLELLGHVTLEALPLRVPSFGPQQWLFAEAAVPAAVAIAVLGLAQSLVIARDLKTSITHDLDLHKEVFAQGAANTLAPFFSTFAGSGSFNRTSINVEMGGRTPLSGIVASAAVLLIAWALGPLLTYLPMPVVAAVMMLVGVGMIQGNDIRPLLNRVDGTVFVVTVLAVVLVGLEIGILVAVLASVGFFVASVTRVKLNITHHEDVERIAVRGNLFYASMDDLVSHLREDPNARTVLDLTQVPYFDASAQQTLRRIEAERKAHGGSLELIARARG